MKHLIIIGARGFGREVYTLALNSIGYKESFDIKGFLDEKKDSLEGLGDYPPILDSVENYKIQEDDVFICALGDVRYKKKYVDIVLNKGGEFISLIHKNAFVDTQSTSFGKGCIILSHVHVSCNVKIGNFVTLQPFVSIGHDAKIGNFCHLNTYSFMGGYCELADMVTLHTHATIQPHKKVGEGSIVGACSFVVNNIKPGITVAGNPAVKLEF